MIGIYSYLSLFAVSFGAATVLPMGSEPLFGYLQLAGGDPVVLVLVATLGNWLGGLTTYWLGFLGRWKTLTKYFRVDEAKAEKWRGIIAQRGPWFALLCWVPLVGDLIALALGLVRANTFQVAMFMLVGKFLRYLMMAAIISQSMGV